MREIFKVAKIMLLRGQKKNNQPIRKMIQSTVNIITFSSQQKCAWASTGGKQGRVLKAPPLKSLDLHFLVTKCHCQTYDDNIGPKLKKPSFAFLGAYNMFDTISPLTRPQVANQQQKN